MGNYYTTWQRVTGVMAGGEKLSCIKDISPREAKRIIEGQGMVEVFQSEDGTIYDEPGEPYKNAGYRASGVRGRNQ
jgi:hypothetical protein